MYSEYFGLKEPPFSIVPDPRYLYMSDRHREALAHLIYGVQNDAGFVLLTGEVGTGKTTVCRCLLEKVPEKTDVAFILNPKLTAAELLATICDELGITYPQGNTSIKVFIDLINAYLLRAYGEGRHTVLIIDEAQNLAVEVLEQIRLLTNLETNRSKLLQIILLGQPELQQLLGRPELRQLGQRITARYHLEPLSRREVGVYVAHRLSVAGGRRELFPSSCIDQIYRLSGGTPRLINLLCDRALLGTYVTKQTKVRKKVLANAAREVFGPAETKSGRNFGWWLAALAFLFAGAAMAATYYGLELPSGGQASVEPSSVSSVPKVAIQRTEAEPAPVISKRILNLHPEVASNQSRIMAYAALAEQWGLKLPGNDFCQLAKEQGLRCLAGKGSLRGLKRMNLPAVLSLFSNRGKRFHGTLLKLEENTATLEVAGKRHRVNLENLENCWLGDCWLGDYTILWRPPLNYQKGSRQGDKGEVVEWLESRLASIKGREPRSPDGLTFDEAMVSEVKSYQVTQGLDPDGIVGPVTMLHLTWGDRDADPSLVPRPEER